MPALGFQVLAGGAARESPRSSGARRLAPVAVGSLLLLVLLVPGAARPLSGREAGPGAPPLAGDPIEPGLWRIAGISPGTSSADLEPLRQLVGKAGIVALGESSHTSGGYYTAKHRVFRFLVERAGFRALAIESPWAAAESVATYVRTCQGSAEDALLGLLPEWQSAEVRDLVTWMCQWNRSHRSAKDRLSFLGFDIQQPEADAPALVAFLGRIGVAAEDPLVEGVLRCDGASGPRAAPGAIAAADHAACVEALEAIAEKFAREAKQIIKRTSKTDFEWAKVRRAGLRSWQDYSFFLRSDSVRSDEARDAGMADVLHALQTVRLPKKTRLVTWAHNFHVSRAPMPDPNGPFRTMGTSLAESLGAGYFVVGLIGWEVGIDLGGTCPGAPRPSPSALEGRLHDLGEAHLLVDARTSSSVLDVDEPIVISAVSGLAAEHYDALLFLDSSPPMVPLFRPPC
ncbi:MAG TPA: erythromycin esterase family protein [Thermoanaerobaculia bacterium]|jgi:erythromycin esterase|nr:erythromycin esterase family protein [Thermoanaerobaculia bacterium]